MIKKSSLIHSIIATSLGVSTFASSNTNERYDGLPIEAIENSFAWGCSSPYAKDYMRGKLDKYNLNIGELKCDFEEHKPNYQSNTQKVRRNEKNTEQFSFVSTKDLMKYQELFEITEAEIGGWSNIYKFAGEHFGAMSRLEYTIYQSKRRNIDPALSLGLISQESGLEQFAESDSSSARGHFQLIETTANNLGLSSERVFDSQLNIIKGLDNLQDGWNKATSSGFIGDKRIDAAIRYHMTGNISGTNSEYRTVIGTLMQEISLLQTRISEGNRRWNRSSCKPLFDSPSIKTLSIGQELKEFEKAKKRVISSKTVNQKEIDLSISCFNELLTERGAEEKEKLPNNITKLGVTIKHGEACENDIEKHPYSRKFKYEKVYSIQYIPEINVGVTYSCTGIHYNTN